MKPAILCPFIEQCLQHYPNLDLEDNALIIQADRDSFLRWLKDETNDLDENDCLKRIRQLRYEVFAKFAYLEINNRLSIEEGSRQLSLFAEACLFLVAEHYFAELCKRFGVPCIDDGTNEGEAKPSMWSILCMGKLGGRELNFSSDIDIILCYDSDGHTIPQKEGDDFEQSISVQEFYQHFSKSLIAALNQQNEIGFVFRVDMRLRPFGNSGALICSYSFIQNYLYNHARDWERLAYAKASVLSPNTEVQNKFKQAIRPYVYRQYTDYGILQSIRDMRDKIVSTLRDNRYQDDIKVGFGGIRLLEFSLQSIQFTFYIKFPEFKVRGAFNFLQMLKKQDLIGAGDVAIFYDNLCFLRRLEQRLQIWQDKQTHQLPDESDKTQWQWLADTMQCTSVENLREKITTVRSSVHQMFEQVLPNVPIQDYELLESEQEYDEQKLTLLLARILKAAPPEQLIGNFVGCLMTLLSSRSWRRSTQQAQNRFSKLLPILLREIVKTPLSQNKNEARFNDFLHSDTNADWSELFRLLAAVLQRSAYLSLLSEYPAVLKQVLNWCLQQPWLIQQVIDYPVLLESVVSPESWYAEIQRVYIRKQWQSLVNNDRLDYEHKVNKLSELKRSAVFKVAELSQSGILDTYHVSDCLTTIARQIVDAALQIAVIELRPQWENRIKIDWDCLPILCVGYGKLGSFELGYGSDLDVVVLYDDEQPESSSWLPFFMRLVRKMVDNLSLNTMTGKCYDVDFRLRPDGDKGSLVTGIRQYREYLNNRAWLWEKQALVKARSVTGQRNLAKQFVEIRKQVLSMDIDPKVLKNEIVQMRQKMRKSLDKSNETHFDLKQGEGGLVDIEFLTQYWAMRLIPKYPNLLRSRSVSSLLQGFSNCYECTLDVEVLIDICLRYRALVHQLVLSKSKGLVLREAIKESYQIVINQWQKSMELV
jgi:glutamate-ammonia-ligase adenylyltransferase